MTQMIWKNRNKIITAFEWNGLRIKWLKMPEQSDIGKAPIMWFKKETSDTCTS
jgi:hypothetical protein